MNRIERKWWFVVPMSILTVGSTLWLCWALGFSDPFAPFSVPHLIVFVISLDWFRRLYSWILWSFLLWFAPTLAGDKRLHS